ncbi:molybdenum cofactor synthesis domain protein [Pyrolobus fumarii 1A]|uniref:Molybdenum cofactor synthesis domain protein n=1 Tax=Pyrolobus fumarii (strain DSM 11204 / 1A) TaxID=694429 RepID=G0EHI9_PYRF1|nr:gephyrin-like molybdotransferase Glp [Pyrolobus fumarii]AEM39342.1 molybdenum cofactor synthesis domain protein [Pyrolobus fumarii 1A]
MKRRFERLNPIRSVVERAVNELRSVWKLEARSVPLIEAVGGYAAREYRARLDLPPVDKSVLDGFAVRSIDVAGASQSNPAILRIAGEVRIDAANPPQIKPGEAYKVATGSPLPTGADVVIPVEAARVEGSALFVYKPFAPGYGIMRRGEDYKKGDVIVSKGERITWGHVGVLAAQGYNEIEVFALPRVAVFSVGDEIIEPGSEPRPGKVFNSTRPMIVAYLRSRGFHVIDLGHVGDDPNAIREMLEKGLESAEIVMAIGGSSVGDRDYTIEVLSSYVKGEGGWLVHGFLLRPGRPLGLGIVGGKLVASLSGFPVAAWAQVYTVIERIVYGVYGIRWPPDPRLIGRIERRVTSPAGVMDVVRVHLCLGSDGLMVKPLRTTGSGVLSTLVEGNAVLLMSEDVTGYDEGSLAEVFLLHPIIPPCMGEGGSNEG